MRRLNLLHGLPPLHRARCLRPRTARAVGRRSSHATLVSFSFREKTPDGRLLRLLCECFPLRPLSFASPRQGSLFQAGAFPFRFQALFEGCAPFLSSPPRQGSFPSGEGHPFRLFRLLGPQRGRDASSKQRPLIFFYFKNKFFCKVRVWAASL